MNENNLQKLSDEQLDRLTENIFRSVVLTDEETEEIADSPRLWWQLQSRLAAQKTQREKRRFFAWNWLTAISFGALSIVFAIGAGLWIYNPGQTDIAVVPEQETVIAERSEIKTTNQEDETITLPISARPMAQPKISPPKLGKKSPKPLPKSNLKRIQPTPEKSLKASQLKTEVATNFIPLSYLPATESGQIVRVKVPRSMMVSLGVTTDTARNAELVNAEVIIADDGGARAIRFLK